ncbi:TIGR01777 family oxidoreductase [Desulfogranum mediterraneum]|uniref:TIGR01777 family oxidoreductase n=1 Tax=Desulfogranum mediterraneum TaxID=160661 RepID=UPI000409C057|nr:TIGR01777 family oxidoreductase [Desulfogranum mediterraneum]
MTKTATFVHTSTFPCSPRALYDWHSRPGALERLIPPWERTSLVASQGGIAPGGSARLRLHLGPIPYHWHARHLEDHPGRIFVDTQERGPFSSWRHSHLFHDDPEGCRLEDRIEYRLPGHGLLPGFALSQVEAMLQRIFRYRHTTLRDDILLHQRCSTRPLRILITGASGVLGRALRPLLTTGGHEVWTLVRRKADPQVREIYWNPEKEEIDQAAIPALDGVIHLAGDNIGQGRWTGEKKERMLNSRVLGTGLIARTMARISPRPKVLLSSSAVGFYGNCQDCCMREEDPSGQDFISDVCSLWEQAANPARDAGIRTVFMRIGVVMSPRGGALERLLTTAAIGFSRSFGSGAQFISWISINDMISTMLHALDCTTLQGPVNIAAPTPVSNSELMQTLAQVTGRPLLPSVPAGLLKTLYGQMASEVLLSGCRVATDKLEQSGYTFRHPELKDALAALLGR